MELVSLFQIANIALQNRDKISQAIRWLDGDGEAFTTPDQKLQKLRQTLRTVAEVQESQAIIIRLAQKALVRVWFGIIATFIVAAGGLGLALYPYLHK